MEITVARARTYHRRWVGRAAQALAGLTAVAVLATACSHGSSGPGVASVGSSAPTGQSSSSGSHPDAVAYSQCMRAHGIGDFPDPNSNGQIPPLKVAGQGSDLSPENPQYQAAYKACKALQPAVSAQQRQQDQAQMLKFTQCMRAHGIKNMRDPTSKGINLAGTGIDPHSPQFQAAQKACKQYLPGGGS